MATLKTPGLDKLIKALGGPVPKAKIGVLGGNSVRTSEDGKAGPTNAEIGAAHEYGTEVLPQRSFLRIPISDNLAKNMKSAGLLDKETLKQVIKEGSVAPWLKLVAAEAVGIVLEAFDSGGFGKWPPSDMTKKKNYQTLVETQQLRNSIIYEVEEPK